jgi:hypothetical protein
VSLLFGLHPVNTESVAWVIGRADLLPTFFMFGALALYIQAFPPEGSIGLVNRTRWILVGVSVSAFVLGLFSKESAVALKVGRLPYG